jgi:WD40 repeat protein/serine/threonine protein kinase
MSNARQEAPGCETSTTQPSPSAPPATPDSPAAPRSPEVPLSLVDHARYRILGLLGVGGMGSVYKAEHRLMERTVALKVINPNLVGGPTMVERFRREVKAAARLAHPNIVAAYDAEQAGSSHFLVMEYVEGISLAWLVAEKGPLPVSQACDYIRQAALGLQHAFERGMVHRDIKPQNLMLTPDGQVKVLDFGLARFALENAPAGARLASPATPDVAAGVAAGNTPADSLTQTGTVMGTPDYIAPEQARDAHTADIRADIYSLGCTLYDLLAGQAPFPQGTAVEKVMAHIERTPKPLTEVRSDVPAELARVAKRMMAKDPAERYQTPAEVADALAPFSGKRAARRRWLLPVMAAVLLLGLGLLVSRLGLLNGPPATDKGQREPIVGEIQRFEGHTGHIFSVAFSPDGRHALSGARDPDKTLRLWDVATGRELHCFRGHTNTVRTVAFSPDGLRVLSGSWDKTVRLWNVATGKELQCFVGHTADVSGAVFSPDGHHILSGGLDKTMRLWDVETGQERRQFRGHSGGVHSVAFSLNGSRILSGGGYRVENGSRIPVNDFTVRLWDADSGLELRRFIGHTQIVHTVAFIGDGRRIVSGSVDNTIRIWDVNTQRELHRFEGHAVSFSPDGRRALADSMRDNSMSLWDVESWRELHRFKGHTQEVLSVAFSPDGRLAVTGSRDMTVRLWRLPEPGMAKP